MSSISAASQSTPLTVDYIGDDEYLVAAPTGQGQGRQKVDTLSEAQVNQILAPYGLSATKGQFQSADGFTLTSSNASTTTSFGTAPPLPDVAGATDHTGASVRLATLSDSGDAALMWMALSEMAKTAMRDMKDSKEVKRAMQSGQIAAKKAAIQSTANRIEAERQEADRAFRDACVTAVIVIAISVAGASASSATTGSAIVGTASAVSNVYSAYSTAESKNNGPQAKADEERLREMRWDQQGEMMNQMVEEAQNNYEESKELFKLALRILTEHYELQAQATQTFTRS